MKLKVFLFSASLALGSTCLAEAANVAGTFQFVAGEVQIQDSTGKMRSPQKGDSLFEGDAIVAGKNSVAQIRMADGGLIAVRAESSLRIDTFQFKGKEDGSEKSVISLLKGSFRAITGMIGRSNKQNYAINTPIATIGIRGTDHEPVYIPVPKPGEIALGTPGLYDKVNIGSAIIQTKKGMIEIKPGQAGFVANIGTLPVLLPKIPEFYKTLEDKTAGRKPADPAIPDPKTGVVASPDTRSDAPAVGDKTLTLPGARTLPKGAVAIDPVLTTNPQIIDTTIAPISKDVLTSPVNSTLTPITTTISPTAIKDPTLTTISPTTGTLTTISPITKDPALTTISPTTTIQPITTTIQPPITTTVPPATVTIAPPITISPTLKSK